MFSLFTNTYLHVCWCPFKVVVVVCYFESSKGVYMHCEYCKAENNANAHLVMSLSRSMSRIVTCQYCNIFLWLRGGMGGPQVLRRLDTNWISGQHATIRVWSIFEGLLSIENATRDTELDHMLRPRTCISRFLSYKLRVMTSQGIEEIGNWQSMPSLCPW